MESVLCWCCFVWVCGCDYGDLHREAGQGLFDLYEMEKPGSKTVKLEAHVLDVGEMRAVGTTRVFDVTLLHIEFLSQEWNGL